MLRCLLVGILVTSATAAETGKKSGTTPPPQGSFAYATANNDALTRSGFEHYYEMEYPAAIRDFEKVVAERPTDPFAANHLAAALFFSQLYHAGVMETTLYTNNSFLNSRTPVHLDPEVDRRLKDLLQQSIKDCDDRIVANPNDADAYYARGVARGLQATYTALVQKSWFSALGNAKGARHDHEKVLQLDPGYTDARLIVGMHSYIVGSLPWAVRVLAHVVGEGGNKQQGLRDLATAANGRGEANTDAKVVLALFLRREQRFADALSLEQALTHRYPRNYLFALEEANILKDEGHGPESIATYRKILANAAKKQYEDPQLEFAWYGLGEALKGQRDFAGAAAAYAEVEALPQANPQLQLRSELAEGQMYDLLNQRSRAIEKYRAVIASNGASDQAAIARDNLRHPYHL